MSLITRGKNVYIAIINRSQPFYVVLSLHKAVIISVWKIAY